MTPWMGSAIPDPEAKFPLLISYAYLRKMKPDEIDLLVSNPKIELLLDSGAFTALNAGAEIVLEEYLEFLKTYQKKLFGYFALDKLGDPDKTRANLKVMLKAGLTPLPIHVRGADDKEMDELFSHSRWVGLGGLRRPHRGPASKEYVKQKMAWANGRDVHWLGYTTRSMMLAFRPYSVDCSSWHMPMKYGNLRLYYGQGSWSKKAYSVKDFQEGNYTLQDRHIIERCGFTIEQAKQPVSWRGDVKRFPRFENYLSLHVSIVSWIRYIREIRATTGTRCFLACGANPHTIQIYEWLDKIDPRGGNYVR